MDFSKLTQNEKLAVYGAAASIIGALLSSFGFFGFGALWFTLLLGVAMIVVVFLPQWSPKTSLPGSKGTLMLIVGGIAGVLAILALLGLLPAIGFLGVYGGVWLIGSLIGIAGGLLMGWAGWKEFQAEGGKFQLGTASSDRGAPPPAAAPPPTERAETTQTRADAAPAAAPPPPPPAAAPPPAAPPAEEPRADEPMGGGEERRDQV